MAGKTDAGAKTGTAVAVPVPAYLKKYKPEGLEHAGESSMIPRLKVLQSQDEGGEIEQLKNEYGEGAAIIRPLDLCAAKRGEVFLAVPIFAYMSWEKWRDLKDKGHPTPIVARTTNADSDLAKLCRNPNTRNEPYKENDNLSYKNVESINLILAVTSGPASNEVVDVAFNKGGHKYGDRLRQYLKRQGREGVPLFGNRLEFFVDRVENKQQQKWMQLQHRIPTNPYTPEKDVARLKELFDGFAEMHKARYFDQVIVDAPPAE